MANAGVVSAVVSTDVVISATVVSASVLIALSVDTVLPTAEVR